MRVVSSRKPRSLREAIAFFSDPGRCLEFAAALRWPGGVACPTCGSGAVTWLSTRRMWKCKTRHPRQQFSVKSGTIFADSPIGLEKWFAAIWMVANSDTGVSSHELARALGVTQKTAWFMLDRIRTALVRESFQRLRGEGALFDLPDVQAGAEDRA